MSKLDTLISPFSTSRRRNRQEEEAEQGCQHQRLQRNLVELFDRAGEVAEESSFRVVARYSQVEGHQLLQAIGFVDFADYDVTNVTYAAINLDGRRRVDCHSGSYGSESTHFDEFQGDTLAELLATTGEPDQWTPLSPETLMHTKSSELAETVVASLL